MVSLQVEPIESQGAVDGSILLQVRRSVRDLKGQPLEGRTHGRKDRTVEHVFRPQQGQVARFDVQDSA
jgi:hypothetical protein